MSELADRLSQRIRREGPITFHEWMKAALYDPQQGYYCRPDRERWGRAGDYRTSPERSFLFAATLARYFARLYEKLGSPQTWTIVEAGGGEGHFAETVLQTLKSYFPAVFSVTRYLFDEASPDSSARAEVRLAEFRNQVEFKRLDELEPLNPGIVFSNELLDAFPVHRVTMKDGQLQEFYVRLNSDGGFDWITGTLSTERLAQRVAALRPGLGDREIVEVNLDLEDWFKMVSQRIQQGYLVTIDYGTEASDSFGATQPRRGTLRAFQRHQFADDVLTRPGEQDITSTVDWSLVKDLGAKYGFETIAFERQDKFLLEAGLLDEMELRVNEADQESEKQILRSLAREMILPGGMAESFQVLVQQRDW